MIEEKMQQISQFVEDSYDKILNSIDQILIPYFVPKQITISQAFHQISQERLVQFNFANEVVAEITPLIDQIVHINKEKQQKFELAQITNVELQKTLQELKERKKNDVNNYDQLYQESHALLQLKEQEIVQLNDTQNQIIKDQQETIKELLKQKDDFMLENNKLNELIKQQQENIIQNQQLQTPILLNSFTFSEIYKQPSCQVSQNGKLFFNKSLFYSCLCDQPIPKQGNVKFAYLIHEIVTNQTMVGIGAKEIISKSGYSNIHLPGNGQRLFIFSAYLIMSSGYCFSHHQQDKYHDSIPFTFTNNDIIIIEVDIQKQYIKWIKQSTKEFFLLDIDPNYEYYPCINGTGKVEILNEIIT
ncbi:unnamed protein product [Paramecium primaurelia]|uniref:Uncharacterized protein n=1 Tax=Paramecium primaurelia TaxID=5886 RepID=A0A8S1L668_PARPR|nr:unnamed protein product [Paramecium primaurelia]